MKQVLISISLIVLMSMVGTKAYAYDIAVENVDGVIIYYNYINDTKDLEVTYYDERTNSYRYSGNVIIPEEVTYMNRTRKVTSIGEKAFNNCYGLTSVIIPNSVTWIGEYAFNGCRGLTSVIISSCVTDIREYAFNGCSSLTSVIIPNSVTSIGIHAFGECLGLTSITIPNSVRRLGELHSRAVVV